MRFSSFISRKNTRCGKLFPRPSLLVLDDFGRGEGERGRGEGGEGEEGGRKEGGAGLSLDCVNPGAILQLADVSRADRARPARRSLALGHTP